MNYLFTLFSTIGIFSFIVIGLPWLIIGSWQRDAREIFGASLALSFGALCCMISLFTL